MAQGYLERARHNMNPKAFRVVDATLSLRNSIMDLEWEERRHRELNLADGDAAVPIIRGGLEIAARLEYMSVSTLVIDKYPRLGTA